MSAIAGRSAIRIARRSFTRATTAAPRPFRSGALSSCRTGWPMRCARTASARGDRVAILLPQAPEAVVAHIAIYKLGAHRGAACAAVRRRGAGIPAAEVRREGARSPTRRRAEARQHPANAAGPEAGRARPTARPMAPPDFAALLRGAHRTPSTPETRARRSGADDLHLRHHRPAQGRAARPSRPARPSARRRDAARVLPAAGRPVLDAGRLGLGRRPARRAAAVAVSRRAGGGRTASTSSTPKRPSR